MAQTEGCASAVQARSTRSLSIHGRRAAGHAFGDEPIAAGRAVGRGARAAEGERVPLLGRIDRVSLARPDRSVGLPLEMSLVGEGGVGDPPRSAKLGAELIA
jgi:hypothetical protein